MQHATLQQSHRQLLLNLAQTQRGLTDWLFDFPCLFARTASKTLCGLMKTSNDPTPVKRWIEKLQLLLWLQMMQTLFESTCTNATMAWNILETSFLPPSMMYSAGWTTSKLYLKCFFLQNTWKKGPSPPSAVLNGPVSQCSLTNSVITDGSIAQLCCFKVWSIIFRNAWPGMLELGWNMEKAFQFKQQRTKFSLCSILYRVTLLIQWRTIVFAFLCVIYINKQLCQDTVFFSALSKVQQV